MKSKELKAYGGLKMQFEGVTKILVHWRRDPEIQRERFRDVDVGADRGDRARWDPREGPTIGEVILRKSAVSQVTKRTTAQLVQQADSRLKL